MPPTPKVDIPFKVAVIGGGITGAATAAATLVLARARHRAVDVQLYDASSSGECGAPALLSRECRSRLAALGCRVPPQWRATHLKSFEIVSGAGRQVVPVDSADLWVIDDWGNEGAGRALVARSLAGAAALQGANVISRRVTGVQALAPDPKAAENLRGHGNLAVRSSGHSQAVDVAVLAGGSQATLGEQFFAGFQGAPTLPGICARLELAWSGARDQTVARVLWKPVAGVDVLWLIPAHRSVYALAYGPETTAADFCEALMVAARDGAVPDHFEISNLETVHVPCGMGQNIAGTHRIAAGACAQGHPFDLSISSKLLAASRAALAVVDSRGEEPELAERYLLHGVEDLLRECDVAAKAFRWLRRAPQTASEVFRRASLRGRAADAYPMSSVLGALDITPRQLLAAARAEGIKDWFRAFVGLEPAGAREQTPSAPTAESDLYYVVDDDVSTRTALVQFIESQGARAMAFGDELALYAAVARRPPRAIVLDVVLAWVDGLQLCEGLKSHPLTSDTRVIVVSGLDLPHLRQRALDAGAETFLPKPVEPRALWSALSGQAVRVPAAARARSDVEVSSRAASSRAASSRAAS